MKANPDSDQAKEFLPILESWLKVPDKWTEAEEDLFLKGIQKHGKDYDALTEIF